MRRRSRSFTERCLETRGAFTRHPAPGARRAASIRREINVRGRNIRGDNIAAAIRRAEREEGRGPPDDTSKIGKQDAYWIIVEKLLRSGDI